jgi:radical SAM protein with 4Fe4S-binding SPASM domain
MEILKVKRDRLKPYVYKVEGPVNFAFYDMLKGKFYQFSPEGNVAELRTILLENGLIFETEGIVPNKIIRQDMRDIQNNIQLRNLQIRLNGSEEDNCWNREKKNGTKRSISLYSLERLHSECLYIPIDKIRIEIEEDDPDKIAYIIRNFNFNCLELFAERGLDHTQLNLYKTMCNEKNVSIATVTKKIVNDFKVEIFNFFYSKFYNPCIGHQIALDTNGVIKSCLWSDESFGNIAEVDLKDMIIRGVFDKTWELSKRIIDVCKDCELRHACDDCRVFALNQTGSLTAKPGYCQYNPYTGD